MTLAKRGEIWLADLGEPSGHEQAKSRPCMILQTDDLSQLSTTVVVPLTTNLKDEGYAGRVVIPSGEADLHYRSVALCHQIRALDRRKLRRRIGELPAERVSEIELGVAFVLALP
jgi:mRNA interferase MazF